MGDAVRLRTACSSHDFPNEENALFDFYRFAARELINLGYAGYGLESLFEK